MSPLVEDREPLRRVSAADPCPICDHTDWCGVDPAGAFAICMRIDSDRPARNGGWVHRLDNYTPPPPHSPPRGTPPDWDALARRYAADLDDDRKRELAAVLKLPVAALDGLPLVGFRSDDPAGPCFTFPEVDECDTVIGLLRRFADGTKRMCLGGNRGLTVPSGVRECPGDAFVVEGPTDACAMSFAGLAVVGRPTNSGGVELLAAIFRNFPAHRSIVIVAENDRKPNGDWPGREGAVTVATRLAEMLSRPVCWAFTPDDAKDPREWLVQRAAGRDSAAVWHELGADLTAALVASATTVTPTCPPGDPNSGDFRDTFRGEGVPAIDWAPPTPLPSMPPVPPFPLSVFPSKVADYWRAAGEALSCPVDYVAVPGLTLLGAAVGRARVARVKAGYAESPLFWTAVIAPPGATKSPALRAASAPLHDVEAVWSDRHREAVEAFEAETERYAVKLKEWRTAGCQGEPPEKPCKPALRQIILDDTTVEATAKVLADNPRGVVVVKDELIGFVRSLNQYKGGRGSDREFWLSAWAGAPTKVNRSKDHDAGPLVIRNPFAAFAGMLCPDALGELRGENSHGDAQADGYVDRYLLAFPDPLDAVAETWRVIPDAVKAGYRDVFLHLLAMEPLTEPDPGNPRPVEIPFSIGGRAEWTRFTATMAARMNALDKLDPFRGVLSKLKGYGLRFAALLWCLRQACGELKPTDCIHADLVRGAAVLVDYFEQHAIRCLGRGWADRSIRIATRLLSWLSRCPERTEFTRSEAFNQLKDNRDVKTAEALTPVFRLLVEHGYVRQLDQPAHSKSGPVPQKFVVNPLWVRSSSE